MDGRREEKDAASQRKAVGAGGTQAGRRAGGQASLSGALALPSG